MERDGGKNMGHLKGDTEFGHLPLILGAASTSSRKTPEAAIRAMTLCSEYVLTPPLIMSVRQLLALIAEPKPLSISDLRCSFAQKENNWTHQEGVRDLGTQ